MAFDGPHERVKKLFKQNVVVCWSEWGGGSGSRCSVHDDG